MALQTSKRDLKKHLASLGIPDVKADEYATTFSAEEVSIDYLKFISDNELRDTYNITLGGHRLAIRHSHNQPQAQQNVEQANTSRSTTTKPNIRHKPPQLQPSMTRSLFRSFVSHWNVYKGLVGLPPDCNDAAA